MKDTRFIELVNLYIDRQISPAEANELELEIQSNPRRREVYHQYCRMHRATTLVYESFRSHAEQPGQQPARQPASITQIRARVRQRRARWLYAGAGLAAAACVAFVFVAGRLAPQPAAPAQLARVEAPPPAALFAAVPTSSPVAEIAGHVTDAVERRVAAQVPGDYTALVATLRQEQERILNPVTEPGRLSLFDDGVFEDRNLAPHRVPANLQSRRTRTNAEFTAFQFQR